MCTALLQNLRPDTTYRIAVRSQHLYESGLRVMGDWSEEVAFITPSGVPLPPPPPPPASGRHGPSEGLWIWIWRPNLRHTGRPGVARWHPRRRGISAGHATCDALPRPGCGARSWVVHPPRPPALLQASAGPTYRAHRCALPAGPVAPTQGCAGMPDGATPAPPRPPTPRPSSSSKRTPAQRLSVQ